MNIPEKCADCLLIPSHVGVTQDLCKLYPTIFATSDTNATGELVHVCIISLSSRTLFVVLSSGCVANSSQAKLTITVFLFL